ncbi:hypothetical protein [Amycolatopsis taiwanensis]|nr:hypothetical protein [Amycolatopsis taiwanensis]
MATHPEPIYAETESERDWWLANLHRPQEKYIVDQVPDLSDHAWA